MMKQILFEEIKVTETRCLLPCTSRTSLIFESGSFYQREGSFFWSSASLERELRWVSFLSLLAVAIHKHEQVLNSWFMQRNENLFFVYLKQ